MSTKTSKDVIVEKSKTSRNINKFIENIDEYLKICKNFFENNIE